MIIIIKKIKAAFKSRLEHKKELTDLQKKRLAVCKTCPFNSENKDKKTRKEKFFMFLNKTLNFICGVSVTEEAVCLDCGCQIFFKSTQEAKDLICQKGKWNNIK